MAERETEHRRIVVETPTTRREVVQTDAVNHQPDRSGISGAALAAIVVGVIALATLIILFVMNQQQTANETATQQQPSTTIVQQPAAQQPPVIIEQQAPATQPPVIINNPAAGGSAPATGNDDAVVQVAVDKRLREDATFSGLGITATVLDGKVTLTGIVQNQALKAQVERAIRNIKGVKVVDNQISVG